jgi:hypothetical protein
LNPSAFYKGGNNHLKNKAGDKHNKDAAEAA